MPSVQLGIIKNTRPLLKEKVALEAANIQTAQKLYGKLGVDIFAGEKPSILSQSEKKFNNSLKNRVKSFFGIKVNRYADYDEGDTLTSVLIKYINNRKGNLFYDIKKIFGEKGLEHYDDLRSRGLIA